MNESQMIQRRRRVFMGARIDKPYINDIFIMEALKKTMHGELQYTLMNDFLSKYSFQRDLYALKGLLSALLNVPLDEITNIEILNPVEPSEYITDKNCILDIKLELNHESIINIEIQTRHQDFWPDRSLTYLCRCFDNLREGDSYAQVKPCIHIGILSTDIFKGDDEKYTGLYYSEYKMQEVHTHKNYSDKFVIKVLLLNHIEEASDSEKDDPNSVYAWAKLFTANTWEELTMIAEKNPMMQSFVGTVKQLTADEKIMQMCEARRRYNLDIATYEYEIKSAKDELESVQDELESVQDELKTKQDELKTKQDELDATKEDLSNALARIAELEKSIKGE